MWAICVLSGWKVQQMKAVKPPVAQATHVERSNTGRWLIVRVDEHEPEVRSDRAPCANVRVFERNTLRGSDAEASARALVDRGLGLVELRSQRLRWLHEPDPRDSELLAGMRDNTPRGWTRGPRA